MRRRETFATSSRTLDTSNESFSPKTRSLNTPRLDSYDPPINDENYVIFFQGFAFVSYSRREDAAEAIKTLDGYGYDHLILKVEWAK